MEFLRSFATKSNAIDFRTSVFGHVSACEISNIIHLMSAREGNSFVFPQNSVFPETTQTLSFEEKQNYFPREQTLSVLLYSDEIKIKKYSYSKCIL